MRIVVYRYQEAEGTPAAAPAILAAKPSPTTRRCTAPWLKFARCCPRRWPSSPLKCPPAGPPPAPDNAKEAVLAQLPDLEKSGILDAETAALRRYKLRGEVADLHQQLAQLPPVNLQELSQSVSIPQFWLDLSEPERRFFFREFIRDIQILRQGDDWRIELVLVF